MHPCAVWIQIPYVAKMGVIIWVKIFRGNNEGKKIFKKADYEEQQQGQCESGEHCGSWTSCFSVKSIYCVIFDTFVAGTRI